MYENNFFHACNTEFSQGWDPNFYQGWHIKFSQYYSNDSNKIDQIKFQCVYIFNKLTWKIECPIVAAVLCPRWNKLI